MTSKAVKKLFYRVTLLGILVYACHTGNWEGVIGASVLCARCSGDLRGAGAVKLIRAWRDVGKRDKDH
ncbi:MAG TPA: hypothetical protein VH253_05580 [Phycisphaerae bacterium]|nr:hypothetical protein [Phycisphaerae bacterium]